MPLNSCRPRCTGKQMLDMNVPLIPSTRPLPFLPFTLSHHTALTHLSTADMLSGRLTANTNLSTGCASTPNSTSSTFCTRFCHEEEDDSMTNVQYGLMCCMIGCSKYYFFSNTVILY